MNELETVQRVIAMLFAAATSSGWPPATTGPFWLLAAVFGLVSVFFDDETPRGIPGLDVIDAIRAQRKDLV